MSQFEIRGHQTIPEALYERLEGTDDHARLEDVQSIHYVIAAMHATPGEQMEALQRQVRAAYREMNAASPSLSREGGDSLPAPHWREGMSEADLTDYEEGRA